MYGGDESDAAAFAGTGMEAQVSNILTRGVDNPEFRSTPEYARAWQLANEPKIIRTPTGDVISRPEIPSIFKAPSAQDATLPADEITAEAAPEGAPGEVKKSAIVPGTQKISADQKAYNKDYSVLKQSYDSMKNYIDVLEDLGPQMAIGPLNSVDTQKLESAYSRAMLDAKETNNLGVLNGPDLVIMGKLMGDPTGVAGQIKGKEALVAGGNEAMKQITDNFSALNNLFTDTPVAVKKLSSEKEGDKVSISDKSLTATIDGKKFQFPDKAS
ncbi:unnamed protein product, partial [marine sediment metagenome]